MLLLHHIRIEESLLSPATTKRDGSWTVDPPTRYRAALPLTGARVTAGHDHLVDPRRRVHGDQIIRDFAGFEPGRLQLAPQPHIHVVPDAFAAKRVERFALSISTLARSRFTTQLHPRD